ncbi:MAG: helix-turn-helix domain-containing protein [Bacteroidales bacterium]|nr:helix-turn-helix domain-containing protein [Bacteroidales bacterium]
MLPVTDWEQLLSKLEELTKLIVGRNREESDSEWLESSKARKMLGVSPKTWQNYRDNRTIPFSQFGRKIYVKRSDLFSFMEKHYITAKSDIA